MTVEKAQGLSRPVHGRKESVSPRSATWPWTAEGYFASTPEHKPGDQQAHIGATRSSTEVATRIALHGCHSSYERLGIRRLGSESGLACALTTASKPSTGSLLSSGIIG